MYNVAVTDECLYDDKILKDDLHTKKLNACKFSAAGTRSLAIALSSIFSILIVLFLPISKECLTSSKHMQYWSELEIDSFIVSERIKRVSFQSRVFASY